jgi:hypothetical protein
MKGLDQFWPHRFLPLGGGWGVVDPPGFPAESDRKLVHVGVEMVRDGISGRGTARLERHRRDREWSVVIPGTEVLEGRVFEQPLKGPVDVPRAKGFPENRGVLGVKVLVPPPVTDRPHRVLHLIDGGNGNCLQLGEEPL